MQNHTETEVHTVNYAGFWIRYLAFFLDALVIFIVLLPVYLLCVLGLGLSMQFSSSWEGPGSIITFAQLILPCFHYLYLSLMEGFAAATIGKMLLGLQVRSVNLTTISVKQSFLRNIYKLIPLYLIPAILGIIIGPEAAIINLIILIIAWVSCAFSRNKRTLHDRFASTVVVKRPDRDKMRLVMIWVAAILNVLVIIASLIPVILSIYSLQRYKSGVSIDSRTQLPFSNNSILGGSLSEDRINNPRKTHLEYGQFNDLLSKLSEAQEEYSNSNYQYKNCRGEECINLLSVADRRSILKSMDSICIGETARFRCWVRDSNNPSKVFLWDTEHGGMVKEEKIVWPE